MMIVTKIIIADDHSLIRKGLVDYIQEQPGWSVVAEANDGEELLQKALAIEADVIITDIVMPKKNGDEVIEVLAEKLPHIPCIAISLLADPVLIYKVMKAGAKAFYIKTNDLPDLAMAIREVIQGRIFYCGETRPLIRRYERELQAHGKDVKRLTEREKEIIRLFCQQYTVKEIAAKLDSTPQSIESYSKLIKQKTGTKSLAGMVVYAMENRIYIPKK